MTFKCPDSALHRAVSNSAGVMKRIERWAIRVVHATAQRDVRGPGTIRPGTGIGSRRCIKVHAGDGPLGAGPAGRAPCGADPRRRTVRPSVARPTAGVREPGGWSLGAEPMGVRRRTAKYRVKSGGGSRCAPLGRGAPRIRHARALRDEGGRSCVRFRTSISDWFKKRFVAGAPDAGSMSDRRHRAGVYTLLRPPQSGYGTIEFSIQYL